MPKRKRSKAFYKKSTKKRKIGSGPSPLTPGVKGILITSGDKAKFCVPEAYNLLNEYADQLYGPDTAAAGEGQNEQDGEDSDKDEAVDISQYLQEELEKLKQQQKEGRRFSSMNTGAKHLVFIKCSDEVDPAQLVHKILTDALETKVKKARYCLRLLPVAAVCRANMMDICEKTEAMLSPHFHQNYIDQHTYCVQFKARNSDSVKRDVVIRTVADLVTREDDYPHRADLKNPEFVVDINVIGSLCCLGLLKDFYKLHKYNLQSLTELPSPSVPQPVKPMNKASVKRASMKRSWLSGAGGTSSKSPCSSSSLESDPPSDRASDSESHQRQSTGSPAAPNTSGVSQLPSPPSQAESDQLQQQVCDSQASALSSSIVVENDIVTEGTATEDDVSQSNTKQDAVDASVETTISGSPDGQSSEKMVTEGDAQSSSDCQASSVRTAESDARDNQPTEERTAEEGMQPDDQTSVIKTTKCDTLVAQSTEAKVIGEDIQSSDSQTLVCNLIATANSNSVEKQSAEEGHVMKEESAVQSNDNQTSVYVVKTAAESDSVINQPSEQKMAEEGCDQSTNIDCPVQPQTCHSEPSDSPGPPEQSSVLSEQHSLNSKCEQATAAPFSDRSFCRAEDQQGSCDRVAIASSKGADQPLAEAAPIASAEITDVLSASDTNASS